MFTSRALNILRGWQANLTAKEAAIKAEIATRQTAQAGQAAQLPVIQVRPQEAVVVRDND